MLLLASFLYCRSNITVYICLNNNLIYVLIRCVIFDKVFFFEYSLNNRAIYYDEKDKFSLFNLKNLTWDNYLVWNDDHKTLEENQIIKAKYFNFGTISFGPTKNFNLKTKSSNSILIFDLVPLEIIYSVRIITYVIILIIK